MAIWEVPQGLWFQAMWCTIVKDKIEAQNKGAKYSFEDNISNCFGLQI